MSLTNQDLAMLIDAYGCDCQVEDPSDYELTPSATELAATIDSPLVGKTLRRMSASRHYVTVAPIINGRVDESMACRLFRDEIQPVQVAP